MIKRQFTLYLTNRPGVLAGLTGALAKAKINIEGISVAESTDTALVQIIVDKAGKADRLFKKEKIAYTSQDVSVIVLAHTPGALASLAAGLAKAKVNVNYVYATAPDDSKTSCLVIGANDLKKVEAVVRAM